MESNRTFFFVRHGQSVSNALHADNGFIPIEHRERIRNICPVSSPLTTLGEKQAEAAGQLFARMFAHEMDRLHLVYNNQAWIAIRDSGFTRTRITQKLFMAQFQANLPHLQPLHRIDVRLRERHPGTGFYMTRAEFEAKYADQSFAYKKNPYFTVPPGGESIASRENDVNSFINSFGNDRMSELVIAFTHGGFMRALERLVHPENNPDEVKGPHNCEIYVLWGKQNHGDHFLIRGFEKINLLNGLNLEDEKLCLLESKNRP